MVAACFKEKSTFLKCVVFLISVLVMVLVALAVILINRKDDNHVCKSESCINISANIIKFIDKNVNPCDDFHAFTCGNFMRNRREMPPPKAEDEIKFMIRQIGSSADSRAFLAQKLFYASCSNLASIEMDDDETLLDLFNIAGDWPVIRGAHWDGTLFEWTDIAKRNRRLGLKFDWFLEFSVYQDWHDTGLNILKIDVPNLTPLKDSEIFPRQKLLTEVAVSLGAPVKLAHYETGRTIDFENELATVAEAHRSRKKNLLLKPPKVTIREVQNLWPNIRWRELINNITNLNLQDSDYIIFEEVLDYVKDLNKLIYGTPKRIVADYMMWKIVEELWPFLSQLVREKFEDFHEKQFQQEPELNRQKFCVAESRRQFPLIAEADYIRRHVTQEKRELVKEMLTIIKNKFINLIRKATWISKEARQKALQKLENLEFLVGGPRVVFDELGFGEDLGLYGFSFKTTNIIEMLTERKLRFYNYYYSKINRMASNTTLDYYRKVINISRFTLINGNTLVIPAAILKNLFYNPKLPNYFNYATLGRSVSYEIFELVFERDNNTLIDDENRNYNSLWTSEAFDSAVKCLIKESSYTHNSELRKPKKIRQLLADFVAPEIAYESYKEWSLLHPQEAKLPALEFTPSQLFWIHTTKLSCSKIHSKQDRDYSRIKIIGALRNSRNFAKDYNCTESDKMVALKQCKIL